MSSGNKFLSAVEDELTCKLVEHMNPPGAEPARDPAALETTWRPVAKLMVNLIVASWLKTVEQTERVAVVEAKDAWEARRSQANLPGDSGLTADKIAEVEKAAWDVFTSTSELAQTVYFKMNDQMYMVRRADGAITAEHFPAQ